MRMRRLRMRAASAGMLSIAIGCATTSRGLPGRAEPSGEPMPPGEKPSPAARYSTGRATQDFEFPSGRVAAAVLEAMEDLNIQVTRRDHDGPASQIDGRTPDNRTVTVTLRPQKPITHVSCRVGWFGDEPFSRTLLRRIAIRLGTLPPEAIPETIPSAPASNPYFSRDAVPDAEMMRDFIEAPYRSRPDM
jgi:hypothetical protein